MGLPIIGDVITAVKDLVGEVVVDKDKRIEINYKLQELEDRANQRLHEEMMGQIEVNKEEAKHQSIFVAGWRPAVGWIGALGLGYNFVLEPFMSWIARIAGYVGQFPMLDTQSILYLLGGMLGFGGLRSFEKVKGVESSAITKAPEPAVKTSPEAVVVPQTPKKGGKSVFKKIGKLF